MQLVRRQLMPGVPTSRHPTEGKGSTADLQARQEDDQAEQEDDAAGEPSAEGQGEEAPALSLMRVLSS